VPTNPAHHPASDLDLAKLLAWADRLTQIAATGDHALPNDPTTCRDWIARFNDEAGHRRAIDPIFLNFRLSRSAPTATSQPSTPQPPIHADKPDIALWQQLLHITSGTKADPKERKNQPPVSTNSSTDNTPRPATLADPSGTIEVWTETDLCALHALGWLAQLHTNTPTRSTLRNRVTLAVLWYLEHIQPDNATNHPWAVHLFAAESCRPTAPHAAEADLFAQTLLHNAIVTMGRPDRISAHILADAADWLYTAHQNAMNSAQPRP